MVQIGSVVLNVTGIGRAAAFWRGALEYVPRAGGHPGVGRLIALGARRVDWVYPPDASFVVLSDTEGNLFCVVNTEGGAQA